MASEFESARLYLAKWARVVAEEGERARRSELAAQARIRGSRSASTPIPRDDDDVEDLGSSLGVFSLLPSKAYSKRPVPSPTRSPQDPITFPEWEKWAKEGKDELFVRQQIFRRGFSDMEGDKLARREGWEVLLGVVPWSVGGFGPGEQAVEKRKREREEMRQGRRRVYEGLKSKWRAEFGDGSGNETWKEEWHRIDVRPSISFSQTKTLTAGRRSIVGGQIGINRSTQSQLRRLYLERWGKRKTGERVRRVNGRMMKRKEVWRV